MDTSCLTKVLMATALAMTIQSTLVFGKSEMKVKRATSHERYSVDYATNMAIQGVTWALKVTNPLVSVTAGFVIGTVLNLIWPTDSYSPIRAKVIKDIRKEMNTQSIARMKLKLNDYNRQIKSVFDLVHINNLPQWRASFDQNGMNLKAQENILKQVTVSNDTMRHFKTRLTALAVDIGNDRQNFFQPNDPISSLGYYREFATVELNMIAAQIMVHASQANVKENLRKQFEAAGKRHYRMMLWLAHKSAMVNEVKTKDYTKYGGIVTNILSQMPMEKWKSLGKVNYDLGIRHFDTVALKATDTDSEWMSCRGSGSTCRVQSCPGKDNPYDTGSQYQYYYKCRGEVFDILGNNRYPNDYIRSCDKVALRYSYWFAKQKGYWLSIVDSWWWHGKNYYNTRTCPGRTFFNGNLEACRAEVFTLTIAGKGCGAILMDRDAFVLQDRLGTKVGKPFWIGPNMLRPYDRYLSATRLRIFKIYSVLKSYQA